MSTPVIVCAGGGTGGHVFPLVAVADALRNAAPHVRVVFVGTERGIEKRVVPERGYELELLQVLPLRGNGLKAAVRGVGYAALALPRAVAVLRRRRPLAVLSIGGYAAGPVALAARALGIPLSMIEPNADIGLSNRLVAPLVSRAYTAFPEAQRFFRSRVVLETGVPIRTGFAPAPYARAGSALRVLVLGGSQGSRILNEVVPRALARLPGTVRVVHQCGATKEEGPRKLYAELGLADQAQVEPFLNDVPAALVEAELVIGRAGASTVAEICAVGRPSLLLPYPFAGDHQRFNAQSLERRGAARCVLAADATAERLASEIAVLLSESGQLRDMAERARALGRPRAAELIAEDVLDLAGLMGGAQRAFQDSGMPNASQGGGRPAMSSQGEAL